MAENHCKSLDRTINSSLGEEFRKVKSETLSFKCSLTINTNTVIKNKTALKGLKCLGNEK